MSITAKVFSNTFFQVAAKISSAGATVVISALITRILGAKTFGDYSIVTAYVTTFYMLADLGLNPIVVKDFFTDKTQAVKRFTSILGLRLIVGLLLTLVAVVVLDFFPYSQNIKNAIYISMPLVLFNSITRATSIIFQAFLKYSKHFIATFTGSMVGMILVAYFILSGDLTLTQLIALVVIGSAIAPALSVFLVREYISFGLRWFNKSYWLGVVVRAFPIGAGLALNLLMIQTDRLMLSVLKPSISVGIYSLAYRIFDLVLVLPTFFMNAMYPVLIKLKSDNPQKYPPAVFKSIGILIASAVLITIVGLILSPIVIPLIWGREMVGSISAFNILILGAVFFFATAHLSWVIVIEGKQRYLPVVYGLGFIFNVVVNAIVIPQYDYIGAAWATVITEVLVLVGLVYLFKFHKD